MRLLSALLLSACACRADDGARLDRRFVGTFTQRTPAGYNTLRLAADGRAEYVNTYSDGGAAPESVLEEGRASAFGDTAFVRMATERGPSTLRFVLRGDSLVMLDEIDALSAAFVRAP